MGVFERRELGTVIGHYYGAVAWIPNSHALQISVAVEGTARMSVELPNNL